MAKILIENGTLVNEGAQQIGYIVIDGNQISKIGIGVYPQEGAEPKAAFAKVIDATGQLVMAGAIDDQVHFREPGLTYKGNIQTESRAAVAGGVTTFMDMPNTNPPTTTYDLLNAKRHIAASTSMANYAFYFGATNDNTHLLEKLDTSITCGVKLFMGSSTGNMLVDDPKALERIFASCPILLATHCESEPIIQHNLKEYAERYGNNITPNMHPLIRPAEACYQSSAQAVELAAKLGTRLHILHLSSAKEMSLFEKGKSEGKQITAEACVHHLWFSSTDYATKGNLIKWNPAIKSPEDREALLEAIESGKIDVIATDHAPHTLEEKMRPYLTAPSGGPLVQHSLPLFLDICKQRGWPPTVAADKMAHTPAAMFKIKRRGYLREGYYADIAVVSPSGGEEVTKENILYKCGWSPLEGYTLSHKVTHTIINGEIVYQNGTLKEDFRGQAVEFNR